MSRIMMCGLFVLAFVVAGWTTDVEACSPRPPYIEWTYPAKNAKDVPTDAVLWLHQWGGSEPKFKVTLSPAESTGAEIKLKVEAPGQGLVKITPEEPLSANTTYTLSYQCDTLNGGDCYGDDSSGTFAFTTGSTTASKEAYTGLKTFTASYVAAKNTGYQNTCEPSPSAHFLLKADGPTASNAVFYTLTHGNSVMHSQTPTFSWRIYESSPKATEKVCATLTMTDHAGNKTGESKELCVTPDKNITTPNPPQVGCHQLSQTPPVAPIGLCLLFFLLSAGRLRRQ